MEKKYYYNGEFHSAAALSKFSCVSQSIVYKRLREGWTAKDAVETPIQKEGGPLDEHLLGCTLRVRFLESIRSVRQDMQPMLGREYTATPGRNNTTKRGIHKCYFVITLESGKPLIVYPEEFEVIGEATPA